MARTFDIYDLNSPMVMPTAPTSAAARTATTPTTKRASARLLRGSAYLLTFAGALFLAALLIAVTPLGAIDADITVLFLVVTVGALAAIAAAVLQVQQ